MFLMIRCSGMASLLLVEILSELHQELDESLFSSDPSGYACDGLHSPLPDDGENRLSDPEGFCTTADYRSVPE